MAKARVVVCGKFEPGSIAKDLENRAEVPSTFEMRTLLALGGLGGTARAGSLGQPESRECPWSIGALDVKTAFLLRGVDRGGGWNSSGSTTSCSGKVGPRTTGSLVEAQESPVRSEVCTKKVEPEERDYPGRPHVYRR